MNKRNFVVPSAVYLNRTLDSSCALLIEDGVIRVIPRSTIDHDGVIKSVDGIVIPGFLDLQVNGGGGVLFNHQPTVVSIKHIQSTHARFGTVAIMPTIITDTPDILERAADAIIAHGQTDQILGIHIEGPHISHGRRGTHSAEYIRPFDDNTMAVLHRLRDANITTKLTLAPEVVGPEIVRRIVDLGVIVSIGHTVASYEQTKRAIDAGAQCATHFMNAMPPLINRDPGPVAAILNAGMACGMICDGIHIKDEMIKIALRAHTNSERIFLVSDSMPTIGGPSQFGLYDMTVCLTDGQLINSEGSLAGAHITQAEGVARLVKFVGLPLLDALHMAINAPANLIGRSDLTTVDGRKMRDTLVISPCAQQVQPLHSALETKRAGEPAL